MRRRTDAELLAEAEALDAQYAAADAFDAPQREADRLALDADPELADSVPDDMDRIAGDPTMKLLLVQNGMQGWLDGTREDIGADSMRAVFYTTAECRAYVRAMRGLTQGGFEVVYRVLVVEHDGEAFTTGEELPGVVDGSEVFMGRR